MTAKNNSGSSSHSGRHRPHEDRVTKKSKSLKKPRIERHAKENIRLREKEDNSEDDRHQCIPDFKIPHKPHQNGDER